MIEVIALGAGYGPTLALDGITLAVRPGSVYAVLGRNGAGKSTLVRCLLGLHRPNSGRALLWGRDVWRERARLLRRVGYVPEIADAPPAASARQLADFSARLYPAWDRAGFEARLERFSLPAGRPFGALSKGQKGQVALALALAHGPELLVLDDPTLGLDPVARHAVFDELILDLADRGTTVFLTTHDLAGVERIADQVAVLDRGRLLLAEPLERLKARFRRIALPVAAAASVPIARLRPVRVAKTALGTEAVVAEYQEEEFASSVPGARAHAMSLEAIFLALVGEAKENE